jgi:hypothetical protein
MVQHSHLCSMCHPIRYVMSSTISLGPWLHPPLPDQDGSPPPTLPPLIMGNLSAVEDKRPGGTPAFI